MNKIPGMSKQREFLIDIFKETEQMYMNTPSLRRSITNSIDKMAIYDNRHGKCFKHDHINESIPDGIHKIGVSTKRSLEAAQYLSNNYPKTRIGVLNFASGRQPGGGVVHGTKPQEESLCRISTLYPCLTSKLCWDKYYRVNREANNQLYQDIVIVSPDVTVFREDNASMKIMDEKDWFSVDILTCPAPNLRNIDKCRGLVVTEPYLQEIIEKRIRTVIHAAMESQIEILVLGAFGCGVFLNPPDMVASTFRRILLDEGYIKYFRYVEFAVYCNKKEQRNYDVFSSILK